MRRSNLAVAAATCGLLLGGCAPERVMGENWAGPATSPGSAEFTSKAAVDGRVEGHVALDCLQAAEGRVADCRVAYESPAGYGFGDAALRMAAQVRVRSHDKPVGAPVIVPLNFCPTASNPACNQWSAGQGLGADWTPPPRP